MYYNKLSSDFLKTQIKSSITHIITILISAGLRRIEEKPHEAGIHPAKVDKSDQYFGGK